MGQLIGKMCKNKYVDVVFFKAIGGSYYLNLIVYILQSWESADIQIEISQPFIKFKCR